MSKNSKFLNNSTSQQNPVTRDDHSLTDDSQVNTPRPLPDLIPIESDYDGLNKKSRQWKALLQAAEIARSDIKQ